MELIIAVLTLLWWIYLFIAWRRRKVWQRQCERDEERAFLLARSLVSLPNLQVAELERMAALVEEIKVRV